MTVESKAAFARRMGFDKSWVTRASQAGRLVLVGEGRGAQVAVEESIERLEMTRGTNYGVSDHWASQRTETDERPSDPAEVSGNPGDLAPEEISRRTRMAQMRKEEAEADKRHRELDELTGALVRRDDIERALVDALAVILGQIENIPDRIAPQVHGVADMDRVRARIKDEMDGLCRRVSDELKLLATDDKEAAA